MLLRRGFVPSFTTPDLPFDAALPAPEAERLASALDRYAFRLFLRGAIQHPDGFSPDEATRFLTPEHAAKRAAQAVDLGLAERLPGGRYRLYRRACSFGGTLERHVAGSRLGRPLRP